MLRGLRCDLPTWVIRVRQANYFADFTGKCQDIAGQSHQPLRGHSSVLHEMYPGN
jgi:hypothetical protein